MGTANKALGDKKPEDLIKTKEGRVLLITLLEQLESGSFF